KAGMGPGATGFDGTGPDGAGVDGAGADDTASADTGSDGPVPEGPASDFPAVDFPATARSARMADCILPCTRGCAQMSVSRKLSGRRTCRNRPAGRNNVSVGMG